MHNERGAIDLHIVGCAELPLGTASNQWLGQGPMVNFNTLFYERHA